MHSGEAALRRFYFRDLKSEGIVVRHRQRIRFAGAKVVNTSLLAG
ncbi:MAG: hypothetical protein RMY34_00300 [Aulosira sp. DedQUE10]|nr:hypothetical protein [Aulosira sp. DedQUE10]